jgi:RPA family protein
MPELKKRETAHKLRVSDILRANQIFEETESANKKLRFIELGNRQIIRVNVIANVVDRYESDGERRFASITIDDGSGQIRARVFGDDINKFVDIVQGDTVLIIGVMRSFNQELYILPELIRKQDPRYLLVRKLEIEKSFIAPLPKQKQEIRILREEIVKMIRDAEASEGIDKEEIIIKIKSAQPEIINQEIKKLLEEGVIYEPRPSRVRYLG